MQTKILLFLGFWWMLGLYHTGDIFGPGLVEASWLTRPTSKTKYNSSSAVITKNADGTTSSTTSTYSSTAKSWYPTQPSGGYYYAPSPGGAGPNVIDLGKPVGDIIGAVGSVARAMICLGGIIPNCLGNATTATPPVRQQEYYRPPEPAVEPEPEEIPKTEPQIRKEGLSN